MGHLRWGIVTDTEKDGNDDDNIDKHYNNYTDDGVDGDNNVVTLMIGHNDVGAGRCDGSNGDGG